MGSPLPLCKKIARSVQMFMMYYNPFLAKILYGKNLVCVYNVSVLFMETISQRKGQSMTNQYYDFGTVPVV